MRNGCHSWVPKPCGGHDQQIENERIRLENYEEKLKLSEQEFELLVTEKEQDILDRELGVKKNLLYAFYDQFVLRNPVEIDAAFARLGYSVQSPYLKRNIELKRQLEQERAKNLAQGK